VAQAVHVVATFVLVQAAPVARTSSDTISSVHQGRVAEKTRALHSEVIGIRRFTVLLFRPQHVSH